MEEMQYNLKWDDNKYGYVPGDLIREAIAKAAIDLTLPEDGGQSCLSLLCDITSAATQDRAIYTNNLMQRSDALSPGLMHQRLMLPIQSGIVRGLRETAKGKHTPLLESIYLNYPIYLAILQNLCIKLYGPTNSHMTTEYVLLSVIGAERDGAPPRWVPAGQVTKWVHTNKPRLGSAKDWYNLVNAIYAMIRGEVPELIAAYDNICGLHESELGPNEWAQEQPKTAEHGV